MHILPFIVEAAQLFVHVINDIVCIIRAAPYILIKSEETYQKQEAWELEWSFYGFSLRLSEHVLHGQPTRNENDKVINQLSFRLWWDSLTCTLNYMHDATKAHETNDYNLTCRQNIVKNPVWRGRVD